jgi:hypothetical protein
MYSSAKRRRIKPFARPTSFDINAAFDIRHYQQIKFGNIVDPYFPAVGTDEAFQVMEGEILMQNKGGNVGRYGDHQLHCFSFANGLEGTSSKLNASAPGFANRIGNEDENDAGAGGFFEKKAVLQKIKYAGVAVTGFKPDVDVYEQGFVLTVAGLNTLFNSGSRTLYPGDIICADIPNPADRGKRKNRALQGGIPHEKLQFVVTPYEELKKQVGSELASSLIMGTALSYSKPGAPVDVVLHRCNVIQIKAKDKEVNQAKATASGVPKKTSKKKGTKVI